MQLQGEMQAASKRHSDI